MQNFRNLQAWQKSHQLALSVYEVSASLLRPEAWPLRDQLLRAAEVRKMLAGLIQTLK